MSTANKLTITIFLACILFCFLGWFASNEAHKKELEKIEKRALLLQRKNCYDWQDIEYIIFSEIQE